MESKYVAEEYGDIVNENMEITNANAKGILLAISKSDYGNEGHVKDLTEKLAYKWSMEESANKTKVEEILNDIYKK